MALIKFDRERKYFDLINPAERIPDDHICFVVKEIVETIDFTKVNERFLHTPGEPAYDREQLTLLVLMGAVDGKFSSRDLANAAKFDFVYIYLTANATPHYRTVQRFKNENKELLREAFVKTREMGREMGIVKLSNLALDGTTVKANASKNSRYSEIDLLIARELVERGIIVDEEEDILYDNKSGYEITPEQYKQLKEELEKKYGIEDKKKKKEAKKGRNKKKRKTKNKTQKRKTNGNDNEGVDERIIKKKVKKIVKQGENNKEEILNKINKVLDKMNESDLDKISWVDMDAHWRPNKQHHYELVYNLQLIVDTDTRLILDNKVVDAATDMNK